MKKIIIIGNGKQVFDSKKRKLVDESTVIRMNNFKIEGFEDYVGTRTDMYSCSPKYLKLIDATDEKRMFKCQQDFNEALAEHGHKFTPQEIEERTKSYFKIYTPPKIESAKLESIIYLWTNDKSTVQSYPFYEKIKVWDSEEFDPIYSTGFRTILYCLSHFNDYEVFITGFDNFLLSGWYWDDKFNMANKHTRTTNYTDGHPYLIERDKMMTLIKNKAITEI